MTIHAAMLWRRLDVPGHDACRLEQTDTGWRLEGAAAFGHKEGPTHLAYRVECDSEWRTVSGHIQGFVGPRDIDFRVARGDAGWTLNDASAPGLEPLLDLDLSFTPATNLQQLRRVAIGEGQAVSLPVAWLDVDAGTLTPLPQVYERRGAVTLVSGAERRL